MPDKTVTVSIDIAAVLLDDDCDFDVIRKLNDAIEIDNDGELRTHSLWADVTENEMLYQFLDGSQKVSVRDDVKPWECLLWASRSCWRDVDIYWKATLCELNITDGQSLACYSIEERVP